MKQSIAPRPFWLFVLAIAMSCFTAYGLAYAEDDIGQSSSSSSNASAAVDSGAVSSTTAGASLTAGAATAPASKPTYSATVAYKVNGAKKWTKSGKSAGKAGTNVEKIKIKVKLKGTSGSIAYRTYEKNKGGWTKWARNGKEAGIANWGMRGMQVKLTGKLAKQYDVVYRVRMSDDGWSPWVVNGGTAGSTGKLGLIDKLQIKLEPRGVDSELKNGTYFFTMAKNFKKALSAPKSRASNKQLIVGSYNEPSLNERFYVRNVAGIGVTLQSISSGKFLCVSGKKIVQKPFKEDAANAFYWKVSWKGGWSFKNVASGLSLKASGKKAIADKSCTRWSLTKTELLASGNYTLVNTAKKMTLAVKNSSTREGAAIIVQKGENTGAESFTFVHKGSNVYQMKNTWTDMALAPKDGSKISGTAVRQYAEKNTKAQLWKVSLSKSGAFKFKNLKSGKMLTAAAKGIAGKIVRSSTDEGADTQGWIIKPATYRLTGDAQLDSRLAKILRSHTSLRSCFSYVVGFHYRSGNKYGSSFLSDKTTINMAREMLDHHSGNCYRFAALFSWLARGLGYNTEVRTGYVPSAAGGWAPHGWVEVYTENGTYVCDPDLAHEMPGHHWYWTTYSGAPCDYRR